MSERTLHVQNLPYQATHFVGRTEEIQALALLLDDPACRLLTLVGPGGIGKTRLVIEIATYKREVFADGVFFVPLQPLSSTDEIATALVEALAFPKANTEDLLREALGYLQDRHLLLVMDNFEHLLAATDLVREILATAPRVKILVTSREALKMREEWPRSVVGLSYTAHHLTGDEGGNDAVQLFVHRVLQMRHDFSLATEAEAVLRICTLVGGMPLALELAASWTRLLSCDAVAAEIENGIDFLATTQADIPEHHRSMQSVIDQTWQRLTPEEQAVFRRLAVFSGGFNREAAEHVAGASLAVMAGLVDKALVWAEGGRYNLHELLRQYAIKQLLAAAEKQDTEQLHLQFFANWLQRLENPLKSKRQLAALAAIEADWHNVGTAWQRGVQAGDDAAIGRMAEAVYLFCEMRSRFQEAASLFRLACQQFATLAETDTATWFKLHTRLTAILVLWKQPQIHAYRGRIEELFALAQQNNESAAEAFCHLLLGLDARKADKFASSVPDLESSLARFEMLGDRYYVSRVLRELIFVLMELGPAHWERAQQTNNQMLALSEATGDVISRCHALFHRSEFARDSAHPDEAIQYLQQAEAIWRSLEDWRYVDVSLAARSHIAFTTGDFITAEALAAEILQRDRQADAIESVWGYALLTQGLLAAMDEDYRQARQLCEEAERLTRTSDGGWRYDPYRGLSMSAIGLADYEQAKRDLYPALDHLVFETTNKSNQLACLPLAAAILSNDDEPEQAVALLGLVDTSSTKATAWMAKWPLLTRLRSKLAADLGPERYATLWEQGRMLDLQTTIGSLHGAFSLEEALTGIGNDQGLVDYLTARELEVLRLLAAGLINAEIADQLVVAVGTVKAHNSNIYSKLGVRNRVEAIQRAIELGLIDRPAH